MKPNYRDLIKTAVDYKRDSYVRQLLKYGAAYEYLDKNSNKIVRYNDPMKLLREEEIYVSPNRIRPP